MIASFTFYKFVVVRSFFAFASLDYRTDVIHFFMQNSSFTFKLNCRRCSYWMFMLRIGWNDWRFGREKCFSLGKSSSTKLWWRWRDKLWARARERKTTRSVQKLPRCLSGGKKKRQRASQDIALNYTTWRKKVIVRNSSMKQLIVVHVFALTLL